VTIPSNPSSRGSERLLWDCQTIGRTADPQHISARARLETELGEDLTQLLLVTLRESEPSTQHEERLGRAAQDVA
jgi:hypothetical protein